MDIIGNVIAVLPQVGGTSSSGREWKKAGFVIETQEAYPKKIAFDVFGDAIAQIQPVGQCVRVAFDIDSHEFNGRWFSNVKAFRIDLAGAVPTEQPMQEAQQIPPSPIPQQMATMQIDQPVDTDKLPF